MQCLEAMLVRGIVLKLTVKNNRCIYSVLQQVAILLLFQNEVYLFLCYF